MRFIGRYLVLALLATMPAACGRVEGKVEDPAPLGPELATGEIQLARALAEHDMHIPQNPLSPRERIVFTKIDLLPDSQAGTSQRQAMVHHYRYADDTVIMTAVDLNSHHVLSVEAAAHFPTAMAPEEMRRAERLARRDNRLQHVFADHGLRIEGRPIQAQSAEEPLFGHRVVHLLLRNGPDYLSSPRVLVDLTTETVLIER